VNVLRSPAYVYGRTLFNNALLRTLTRYRRRLDTSSRARARAAARTRLLSLYTFRRGDERKRGGCGVVPGLPRPSLPLSPLRALSLSCPLFLSLPFSPSRFLHRPPFSLFLHLRFPARFSVLRGGVPLRTRSRTDTCTDALVRARPHTRHTVYPTHACGMRF
jgi:hypothetical protein